jgi:hypothetical protein
LGSGAAPGVTPAAASPGVESPGWNHAKAAEAGSCDAGIGPESAKADFAWFQPRIHSLLDRRAWKTGVGAWRGTGSHAGLPLRDLCVRHGRGGRDGAAARAPRADLARESAQADFALLLPRF